MGHHNLAVSEASKRVLRFCWCPASGLFFGSGKCLFVGYRSSGILVSFYDGDSGVSYGFGNTHLNDPVETNDIIH